ncbi:MAG: hypothetical protein NVS3B21_24160 [Acidimicrobiales bacterium]
MHIRTRPFALAGLAIGALGLSSLTPAGARLNARKISSPSAAPATTPETSVDRAPTASSTTAPAPVAISSQAAAHKQSSKPKAATSKPPAASRTTAVASGPKFGAPVGLPGTNHVSEPGINVAPNNDIYINGPTGVLRIPTSASPVFKSTDGGATFVSTNQSLRVAFPGGGDSNIAIDPGTGTLYMTDLYLASATVSRSVDGAASWVANPIQGVVVQDRQWVAAAGGGVVYHVTHQEPAGLVISRSSAPTDGLVYPQNIVAASPADQEFCLCPPGNLIATKDNVGVIYTTANGVKFAHSSNGGLTFSNSVVSPDGVTSTSDSFPVVADSGGGKLVATWLETTTSAASVHFSTSPDWGKTWTAPRTINTGTGTPVYPWISASGSKVSISMYFSPAVGNPATVPPSAQFFESYLESLDGGATFGSLTTIDPTPAKTGPVCTGGISCTGGRELGDFQTVTLDNAGKADVSYVRVTGTTTQVMFDHQS